MQKQPKMCLTDKRWPKDMQMSSFSGIWKSFPQTAAGPVCIPVQDKAHYSRLMFLLPIKHLWSVWKSTNNPGSEAPVSSFWQTLLLSNQGPGDERGSWRRSSQQSATGQAIWKIIGVICPLSRNSQWNPSAKLNYYPDKIQVCHQISFLLLFTSDRNALFHLPSCLLGCWISLWNSAVAGGDWIHSNDLGSI